MDRIIIPSELIDFNNYIDSQRANRFGGNKLKRDQTNLCSMYVARAIKNGLKIKSYPLVLEFHWYAKDKRKDPDNIAFAKKFILDSMQEVGLLRNDGWREIYGFSDEFKIDKKNPRVEIIILEKE